VKKTELKYCLEMRFKTMALLAMYLFVTLSFIFFMSGTIPFSSGNTQTDTVKVEKSLHHSTVEREAKATFKADKINPVHQLVAVILNFKIKAGELFKTSLILHRNYTHDLAFHRYSYLSFLSLRI